MKVRNLVIAGLVVASLAAAGAWWWHAHQRASFVAASVPARPALNRFPAELVERVSVAERKARGGDLDALRELASLYQINGFTAEAERCLHALMEIEPRNARWPHRLASIRAGYGELEEAIQLWRHTIELAPDHVPARIRLGDAYLKTNRDAEAVTAYESVLRQEAANPYALVGLARTDLKAGNAQRARERLEKAAEQTNQAIGSDLLVTVYEQLGEAARAIALRARTKSAGSYYDPPDVWMDEMIDDCYDVFRLGLVAGFADHRGDPATGRRILERAINLAPNNGRVRLQLAMLCRSEQDTRAAREHLERAAEVDPTVSDVWAQLVELYASIGDHQNSARALAMGLRHCPKSPGLHLERGRRMAAAGQYDTAVAEFRETLRLRPDEADPLIQIAQVYLRLNRTNEAVVELKRALDVEPDHPLALTTLALYSIATGDERGAAEWLRRAHLQVRVTPETLQRLTTQYAQKFGRPYVPESR